MEQKERQLLEIYRFFLIGSKVRLFVFSFQDSQISSLIQWNLFRIHFMSIYFLASKQQRKRNEKYCNVFPMHTMDFLYCCSLYLSLALPFALRVY